MNKTMQFFLREEKKKKDKSGHTIFRILISYNKSLPTVQVKKIIQALFKKGQFIQNCKNLSKGY